MNDGRDDLDPGFRGIAPSGAQIEVNHGDQRAVIVEVGGGLRSYRIGGRDLLDGYAVHEMCSGGRGQALIPWPNRLRDGRYTFAGQEHRLPLTEPSQGNAIHGLTRFSNWTVAERDPSRATMEHTLHPQPGYPFALHLTIEYELSDGGLAVRTSATNAGSSPCPYGAGAHPYLTLGADTLDAGTLRAPGRLWMPTDDRQIPTGREPVEGTQYDFLAPRALAGTVLDTGYGELQRDDDGRARVELVRPDGAGAALWMDEAYPYLMLFTGDSLADESRRRRGLGVEPMTCPPNAFRTGEGVRTLEPGESTTGSWGLSASAVAQRSAPSG